MLRSFKLIQTKLKLKSVKVILLSELSQVWSKFNQANDRKSFTRASGEITSPAQMPLVGRRISLENLTDSTLRWEKKCKTTKKAPDDKTKKHRRTNVGIIQRIFIDYTKRTRSRMDY